MQPFISLYQLFVEKHFGLGLGIEHLRSIIEYMIVHFLIHDWLLASLRVLDIGSVKLNIVLMEEAVLEVDEITDAYL